MMDKECEKKKMPKKLVARGELPLKMKAVNLYKPKDIRCEEVRIPEPGINDVLVKVFSCGICASDIPRVMEFGTYHFPTIPGHEIAGVISKTGRGVKALSVGDRVAVNPCIPCRKCAYCKTGNYFQCENYDYLGSRSDGGFAEYVKVPDINVVKLPETMDFEEGSLVELLAVALHVFKGKRVEPGDNIAVFGTGALGTLIAQVAKVNKADKVFCVDILKQKLEIAEAVGLTETIYARKVDPSKEIFDKTNNLGVDIAIESAGDEVALIQCIKAVKKLGKVLIVGRSEKNINLPWEILTLILRKEIIIYGCYGFDFNEPPDYVWDKCMSLISEGKVRIKPLITHRFKLFSAPDVFEMLYKKKSFFNKVLLIP